MSRATDITKSVVLVVLWVVAIWAVLTLLLGCESLTQQDRREGRFAVEADCDEDTVSVEFELDQHGEDKRIEVKR